jgi:hypothetical protein
MLRRDFEVSPAVRVLMKQSKGTSTRDTYVGGHGYWRSHIFVSPRLPDGTQQTNDVGQTN